MAMSQVNAIDIGPLHLSTLVVFALLYAGWMSIGYNTGFGHASMASVNAMGSYGRRSRAFALFSLGAGGSGLTVFLLGWLVDAYGWRTTAFLSGVGIFLIVVLCPRCCARPGAVRPDCRTATSHRQRISTAPPTRSSRARTGMARRLPLAQR